MGRIKIILADSNYVQLEYLRQQWQDEPDFDVRSLETTGSALLRHTRRINPDVVVMDLIFGDLDGFAVLEKLRGMEQRPLIIVCSSGLDETVKRRCADIGVDFYVPKPAEALCLARRIRMLLLPDSKARRPVYEKERHESQARASIAQLLNNIGMPNKLSGYRYLRRALLYVRENPKMLDDLASGLYATIANEEGTTPTNVERSIRYAIEFVFMYGCLDALQDLFGFTINSNKGKPSNREFIAMMADHLKVSRAVC